MDFEEEVRQAQEELRETRARLSEMREKIGEHRATVRSADGMISVVVDGRGEVVSIAFNTAKWRRMAPAELGDALVKTISKARAGSREELMQAYGSAMPGGLGPLGARAGRLNVDQLVDDVIRKGDEMLAERAGYPFLQEGSAHE
jgi:DNA-binding protein YbaB